MELATVRAWSWRLLQKRQRAQQQSRKGSAGYVCRRVKIIDKLLEGFPCYRQSQARRTPYLLHFRYCSFLPSSSSMISMACLTNFLYFTQFRIKLQAWLPLTLALLQNYPPTLISLLSRDRKAIVKKFLNSQMKFLLSWKSRYDLPQGKLVWYMVLKAELRYMRSISSLLTSYFLLFSHLYILRLPGILIQMTMSALEKRSQIMKTPLISFSLLILFQRWAQSRRWMDRFWGLALRPWKKWKVQCYSLLLKKEPSLKQQQAEASGRPTGRALAFMTSDRLRSNWSTDLIQIWEIIGFAIIIIFKGGFVSTGDVWGN